MTKEELKQVINDDSIDKIIRDDAQDQLDKIIQRENNDDSDDISDQEVSEILNKISLAIEKANSQNELSDQKAKELIADELSTTKFGLKNLSKSVMDLIGKTQSVTLLNPTNQTSFKSSTGVRRLAEIILSDYEAGNNVYLYGGAGTGKTFIAGQVAKYLGFRLITLNCNQFTGELQIIGGQTIEGYQEGKLTRAFGNIDLGTYQNEKGEKVPYKGALLLLDELPKIDPNSAGILNDGLSKIKDPSKFIGKDENGEDILQMPTIENGRGDIISKKNIFVIATGNSKLNEADKDYEANFKQDLSLQDRFAGSTYEITTNPEYELAQIMTNFSTKINGETKLVDLNFIFNFLLKLRMAIIENDRFNSRAFVSTRLMVSFRDTYIAFRKNQALENPIKNPKTLKIAVESFLSLFTNEQRSTLENEVKVDEFYALIEQKDKMPLDELASDMDIAESRDLMALFDQKNPDVI